MRYGFTLIELLIVIAIIGILAATIAPRYVSFTQEAKVGATRANLSSIRGALGIYAGCNDSGNYPADGSLTDIVPNFIQQIPTNQLNNTNSISNACTGSKGWTYASGIAKACNGTSELTW
jgi:prepilin-type N-terminal cleavage/methylation domain-containing protein